MSETTRTTDETTTQPTLHAILPNDSDVDTEVPSTIDILAKLREGGIDLADPIVDVALPVETFIAFAFWSRATDAERVARDVLRSNRRYVDAIRDGVWNRIATWLDDFDAVDRQPSAADARVAIGEVHIPHVEGCVGTFATTKTGCLNVSIMAAGLKGGRSKSLKLGSAVRVAGQCRRMTVGIGYEILVKQHRLEPHKFIALCKILWIGGEVVDEELEADATHPCAANYRQASDKIPRVVSAARLSQQVNYADIPLRRSKAESPRYNMSLEEGTVYSASVKTPTGLSLKGLPVPQIGFNIESTVKRSVDVGWELVPGHDYLRFRAERKDMRMFWAWD